MGYEEQDDYDISLLFKIGTIVLIVTTLFQLIGLASSHWALTNNAEYGTIEYSGLWEKCADLTIGYHNYECAGFVWEDVQVSHWFRFIQTVEVLGFVGLLTVILLIGLYMFGPIRGKRSLKLISIALCVLCGILIIVACIVFGSLKDVMKARHMPDTTVSLSWSFAFSLVAGLGCIGTAVLLCL